MDKNILEDYLANLNKEQREAATLGNESAVVLAAAGSGKTSTLTCRIAYLINGIGVAPHNILAVTFTNKAAKEMIVRLQKMGLDTKNIWVGTFHGICNKILRYHAEEAGLKKNFMILDRQEQETFFKRVLRANGYDPKTVNASDLLDKINNYKENGWRSNRLNINSFEKKVYEMYETACLRDNCVDFGELLLGCYELFNKNEEIKESYAEKFHYILVDEFQDTNELQYKWLKLLAGKHKNIFAVGDDDQCLVEGTLIKTPIGEVEIEKIKIGDFVLAKAGKEVFKKRVINKFEKRYNGEAIELTFDNGRKVISTLEHNWFVAKNDNGGMENEVLIKITLCGDVNKNRVLHTLECFTGKSIEIKSNIQKIKIDNNSIMWFSESFVEIEELKNEILGLLDNQNFVYKANFDDLEVYQVYAKDLVPGMEMIGEDNKKIILQKVRKISIDTAIYDIDVENLHNFFANGVLSHNSIYSFRGAKPENINLLKKDFNAKLIKIEKNYRSDANILSAANAVIANNKNRQGKNLVPTIRAKNHLLTYEALNDEEESSFIASEIKKLRRANINYKNMAILYRTNSQSRSIEKALNAYSIPYIVYGGFRFFDRQEVKHAMAYLRLAHNSDDNLAFLRVANIPVRAIGDTALKNLEIFAQENKMSLFEAAKNTDPKNKKKFSPFIDLIDHLRERCKNKSLPEMVKTIIIDSGLEMMYQNDKKEGPERLDNLYELISAAEVFIAENKNALIEEFLAFSSLESDISSRKRDENADVVKLMTVHASKGLEFEVVFISGLEESLFPHANSLMEPFLIEEERRLMYVAITRAKQMLYLSRSEERLLHGQRNRFIKSRFFREIPIGLIRKIK